MLNTQQVAAAIGTKPRLLRRFLRASNAWDSCGNGGRYGFKTKQVPQIKKEFGEWITRRPGRREPVGDNPIFAYLDQDPGYPLDLLQEPHKYNRQEIYRRRAERERRLYERIIECGIRLPDPKGVNTDV